MLKDKALVRSIVVRAVNAEEAQNRFVHEVWSGRGFTIIRAYRGFTIIRAYRFYKTLSAEPKKKTYIAIDKLLSAKEAIAVMTAIENRHVPIVIRPEDLGIKPQAAVEPVVKVIDPGPNCWSGGLKIPAPAVRPEDLPQDHPDHVCTDKCYDIVPLNDSSICLAHKAVEAVREILNDPNPDRNYKFGDPKPATVFIPEWGPDTDTSNVAAGQPSPYLFPDKPLVPTQDAVFDNGSEVVTKAGFKVCRWHGWKYIDLRDGRCTATDAGSEYLSNLYNRELGLPVPPLPSFDLDEAAPIISWEPTVNVPSMEEMREAMKADPYIPVYEPAPAPGVAITFGTILVILGLIAAYFKWFVK
jgi:hypothetical protein